MRDVCCLRLCLGQFRAQRWRRFCLALSCVQFCKRSAKLGLCILCRSLGLVNKHNLSVQWRTRNEF